MDLRCYTLLKPCPSPTISLDLPDLGLKRSWPLSELTAVPPEGRLRELAGIEEGATPGTGAVACHAFLYLLTHICGDKLRYAYCWYYQWRITVQYELAALIHCRQFLIPTTKPTPLFSITQRWIGSVGSSHSSSWCWFGLFGSLLC